MVDNLKKNIMEEAKRIGEDAIFSSKGHFNDAAYWEALHLWLGIPSAIAAAVAGAFAFSNDCVLLVGFLSVFAAVCTSVLTFVNPDSRASKHHNAGTAYNALKNDARVFSEITVEAADDIQKMVKELKSLNDRRTTLNTDSPKISRCGFEKARKGIEQGESTYEVDK
ncbi:MAG: SLATT domain-containing protein [Elusimicrobiota bacterium]